MRGAYVCIKHGAAAPQVRAQAEFRLWRAGIWARAGRDLARRLRALEARRLADPEGLRAETLVWLREAGERLAEFKRANNREPRKDELELILLP